MHNEPRPEWPTPTQQALNDLAQRLDVPISDLVIELVEEVTWPDGSYGCPQPGMRYRQVIINGYRIVLSHAGKVYRYHGGVGRRPFLCQPAGWTDRPPRRILEPRLPPVEPGPPPGTSD